MSPVVLVQDVDLARGYVSGTMQASNVPGMEQHIETFWEGCVIDDINHTFFTRDCGASKHIDLQHWAKFEGWSEHLRSVMQAPCLRAVLRQVSHARQQGQLAILPPYISCFRQPSAYQLSSLASPQNSTACL